MRMLVVATIALALLAGCSAANGQQRKLLQSSDATASTQSQCLQDSDCGFMSTGRMGMACSFQEGYQFTCVPCGEFGTSCPSFSRSSSGSDSPGVCGVPRNAVSQCSSSVCSACSDASQDQVCTDNDYYVRSFDAKDFQCRTLCRQVVSDRDVSVNRLVDSVRTVQAYEEETARFPVLRFVQQEFQNTEFNDDFVQDYVLEDKKVIISEVKKVSVEVVQFQTRRIESTEFEERRTQEVVVENHVRKIITKIVRVPKKVVKVIRVAVKVVKVIDVYVPKEIVIKVIKIVQKKIRVPKIVKVVVRVPQQDHEIVKVAKVVQKRVRIQVVEKQVVKQKVYSTSCCICAGDYFNKYGTPF